MDSSTLSYILGGLCVVIALVELYFLRRMLHAFRPLRDENRLSDIVGGRSHFRFVPDNIGPLKFAASTHYVPTFLSTKEKSKFVGIAVLYVTLTALVVGLLAYFLWDNRSTWATSTIIMSFVTLLLLILLLCIFTVYAWKYIPFKCRRQATDMFVGRDGVALYKFKDTREEIAESKVIPFAHVHNILRKREAVSSKNNRIEYLYIGSPTGAPHGEDAELLKLRAVHNTLLNKPATLQFLEAADNAYAFWQQDNDAAMRQVAEEAELRARAEAAEQAEAARREAEAQRLAAEEAEAAERAKKTDTTDYFSSTATFK